MCFPPTADGRGSEHALGAIAALARTPTGILLPFSLCMQCFFTVCTGVVQRCVQTVQWTRSGARAGDHRRARAHPLWYHPAVFFSLSLTLSLSHPLSLSRSRYHARAGPGALLALPSALEPLVLSLSHSHAITRSHSLILSHSLYISFTLSRTLSLTYSLYHSLGGFSFSLYHSFAGFSFSRYHSLAGPGALLAPCHSPPYSMTRSQGWTCSQRLALCVCVCVCVNM